jgi:hypothetical protein
MALLIFSLDDVEHYETAGHHQETGRPSELDSGAPTPTEAEYKGHRIELGAITYETIRIERGWISVVFRVVCNFP